MCWASLNRPLKIVVAIKCGSKSKKPGPKKIDRRGNWTPNLRDWNPTRYHCAIRPEAPPCHILHIYNAVGGLKSLSDLVRPKSRCFEHPFELRKNDPIWISIHPLPHLPPSRPTSKKKSFFSLSLTIKLFFFYIWKTILATQPTSQKQCISCIIYHPRGNVFTPWRRYHLRVDRRSRRIPLDSRRTTSTVVTESHVSVVTVFYLLRSLRHSIEIFCYYYYYYCYIQHSLPLLLLVFVSSIVPGRPRVRFLPLLFYFLLVIFTSPHLWMNYLFLLMTLLYQCYLFHCLMIFPNVSTCPRSLGGFEFVVVYNYCPRPQTVTLLHGFNLVRFDLLIKMERCWSCYLVPWMGFFC